jgi:hypothetical protein
MYRIYIQDFHLQNPSTDSSIPSEMPKDLHRSPGASGEASPTFYSCYVNFNSLLLLFSLQIDCFYRPLTRKN